MATIALGALGLAGCGGGGGGQAAAPPAPSPFKGTELQPVLAVKGFTLTDQDGKPVSLAAQRGKLVVVTFLYTHCPDVCPLIASNLNQALRELGARRAGVRVIAISVDPKGDTAAAVRTYVRQKHLLPQFRYLIGTRGQLRPVWRGWNVEAVDRSPDLVDHSAYTTLVDKSGKGRVLYGSRVTAAQVVHDLRYLLDR
ncbi:MAG: hypothetical protein QOE36_64 [Gaiellaceae bacterium]|jgi:protein SCO1/2|nr:hypothetical protein [Gaiellaceae bacterium]